MPHALAARDFEHAADLVEQHLATLMTRGEMSTLLHWIKLLPVEVTQRRPWLLVGQGWIHAFAGNVRLVEPLAQQAEQLISDRRLQPKSGRAARERAGSTLQRLRAFVAQIAGEDVARSGWRTKPIGCCRPTNISRAVSFPIRWGAATACRAK